MRVFAKRIYDLIPCKPCVYRILKRFCILPDKLYQHLHFNGWIRVPIDSKGLSVILKHRGAISENQLFWAGIDGWYERTSLKLWLQLVKSSTCIADVGANSGFYALAASAINPAAQVFAFEPVPDTFSWLLDNIKANACAVKPLQLALSNTNSTAEIYLDSLEDHYGPSLYQASRRQSGEGVRIAVRTRRLDDFLAAESVSRIDLMKIDVERHEPEVLQGGRIMLKTFRPTLLVEVLDDNVGKLIEQEVAGLGYWFFSIHEPTGVVRQVKHMAKSDSLNFLIIQPQALALSGLEVVSGRISTPGFL